MSVNGCDILDFEAKMNYFKFKIVLTMPKPAETVELQFCKNIAPKLSDL